MLFPEVNKIFHQAGMSFYLAGPIRYTNRTEWLNIRMTNRNDEVKNALLNLPPNVSGGLELYFVKSIANYETATGENGEIAGFEEPRGIAVAVDSVKSRGLSCENVVAHEIGHACKLDDIFDRDDSTPPQLTINGPVVRDDCPDDSGLYPQGLMQQVLVRRLLMYGYGDQATSQVIPRGAVYGVADVYPTGWVKGLVPVGVKNGLDRNPSHN